LWSLRLTLLRGDSERIGAESNLSPDISPVYITSFLSPWCPSLWLIEDVQEISPERWQWRPQNRSHSQNFPWIRGVTTNMMIRASWEKASFSYHQRDGTFYLAVDKGRIRGAPDFCEIWERNYPIESLSAKRRNQKWGWVNQQFFRVK
jgi:hypothetical protein